MIGRRFGLVYSVERDEINRVNLGMALIVWSSCTANGVPNYQLRLHQGSALGKGEGKIKHCGHRFNF